MNTLKEIIVNRKTRKGPADKITKDGAYWETGIKFGASGGDGIGCSAPDISWYLEIRHYRDGHLRAYINRHTWHQNDGSSNDRTRADDLLDTCTVEELIAMMQRHEISCDDYAEIPPCRITVTDWGREKITKALLEMTTSAPSPDEA